MSEETETYDVNTLDVEELRHECARLAAELDAALKSIDHWKARHELAVVAAQNLCDELTAVRRELEAEKDWRMGK